MKNYDVVEQPTVFENLTLRFTDEAVNFIQTNKDSPFLLYMSYAKVHTPPFTSRPFANHSAHGRYGDNVEEMDWSVGQIMAAVDKLGLKENTFVYFTSDNGPHLEQTDPLTGEYQGGWKGIYKGGKPDVQRNSFLVALSVIVYCAQFNHSRSALKWLSLTFNSAVISCHIFHFLEAPLG